MHGITVRRAAASDLETLELFQRGVVSAERPYDRTLKDDPIHYYDIRAMLDREEIEFVLAESGVRPVGCGFARIQVSKPYLKHALHAYLGLMYVVPEFRGHGINGRIIDALKAWCRSRGVTELRLEVYHGNLAALRAYEKTGFSRHLTEMRASLVEPPGIEHE